MDLSYRDLAFLFWTTVGVAALLIWPTGREAVRRIVNVLRGKLLAVALLYAVYFALVVAGAQALGAWSTGLLRDTLAWFVLAGIPLLAKFPETYKDPNFYRGALRRLIAVSVAVEFFIGLTSFSFGAELLLLPAIVVLGLFSAVAGPKPEWSNVKSVFDIALGLLGLAVIVVTAMKLIELISTLDPRQLGLMLFLPVWATFFSLLFVFVFGLYANYEPKIGEINRTAAGDRRARWRAKLALFSAFWMRNLELGKFAPFDARELAQAKSWGEARRYVTHKRAEIRHKMSTDELTFRRLARYAGVPGTDWEGHPLDQREFAETKKALDTLATFHQAQFKDGRYRADLMAMVGGLLAKTFPESEIVMAVRKSGRAWYAWRRTVTGWCFGIGAMKPPPDRWTYQGPEPPAGFPRKDDGWEPSAFDTDGEDEE